MERVLSAGSFSFKYEKLIEANEEGSVTLLFEPEGMSRARILPKRHCFGVFGERPGIRMHLLVSLLVLLVVVAFVAHKFHCWNNNDLHTDSGHHRHHNDAESDFHSDHFHYPPT